MPRPAPRWLAPLVLLVAVAVHLPCLWAGFYADDYLHQLALAGELPLEPWGLYDFGTAERWRDLPDGQTGFPWWTSPDWKIRFFRPLASLSLALDHAVYGAWAPGYAITGLLLYAVALALALRLFRALGLGPRVAIGALALFAASTSTVLAVGWAANRNSLVELALALAATLAAWTGARDGRRGRLVAAWLFAFGAAATKESGIVLFPLVGAAIVAARPGGTGRPAWLVMLAALVPAVLWMVGLALAGYGTRSLFYITPWADPLAFARSLTALAPLAALHALTPFPTDLVFLEPALRPATIGVGAVLGIGALLWGARRWPARGATVFLLVWVALTVAPQAGAPVSDRLFVVPMVALAPLVAWLVAAGWRGGRGERALAWVVVATAGALPLVGLVVQRRTMNLMIQETRETITTADVGDPSLGRREVFVLQSANAFVPFAMTSTWAVERADRDLRFWVLQIGRRAIDWRRVDARTFEIESLDEPFLTDPFEFVYRSTATPPAPGDTFTTPLFTVTVLAAEPTGVRAFRVTLDEELDPERYRFLVPEGGAMVHRAAPAVGQTLRVERAVPPRPFTP